jgi:P27 family predicted phage terminase small subunit
MARTGPAPLPTAIKKLRGTLRKDRTNQAEPATLPMSSLAAPTWLDDDGRKAFRRLARQSSALRVLSESDLPLLALLADQWAIYLGARKFLKDQGSDVYTLRSPDGDVRSIQPFPQVAIRNKAALAIARLSAEFGLSPASRSRVNASAKPEGPADELEGYLVGGGKRG